MRGDEHLPAPSPVIALDQEIPLMRKRVDLAGRGSLEPALKKLGCSRRIVWSGLGGEKLDHAVETGSSPSLDPSCLIADSMAGAAGDAVHGAERDGGGGAVDEGAVAAGGMPMGGTAGRCVDEFEGRDFEDACSFSRSAVCASGRRE